VRRFEWCNSVVKLWWIATCICGEGCVFAGDLCFEGEKLATEGTVVDPARWVHGSLLAGVGGGWVVVKLNGCNELAKMGPLNSCIQRGCAKFVKAKGLRDEAKVGSCGYLFDFSVY
jgi:hypothetical protein